MQTVRIGIIGLGRMGANHLSAWTRTSGVDVVAAADPDPTRAAVVLAHSGAQDVELHADWNDLLARDDIDAVSVVCPSSLHAEVSIAALEAGKHVLVEKPIATTVPDAMRIATTADRVGKLVSVGHVERFNPAAQKMRELLSAGALGRVFQLHATRVGPSPVRIMDAGVTLDLATHDVDLMQWLTGQPITEVMAETSRFQHSAHEDLVHAMLRFGDDGPNGLLDVNWLTPEKRREMIVVGEEGQLRASWVTQDLFLTRSGGITVGWDALARLRGDAEGEMIRFAIPKVEPLVAEFEAFRDAVRDGGPAPVSALEGARALAAVVAIRESAVARAPRRPTLEPQPATESDTLVDAT